MREGTIARSQRHRERRAVVRRLQGRQPVPEAFYGLEAPAPVGDELVRRLVKPALVQRVNHEAPSVREQKAPQYRQPAMPIR